MSPIDPELDRRLSTTQAIHAEAQRLARELPRATSDQLARLLNTLTDQLISNLLPLLDAEEEVVCSHLETDLWDALKNDHRTIRALTERLAMLSENVERRRGRAPEAKPVARALREVMTALEALDVHQRAVLDRLDQVLPADDQEQLWLALEAATASAREHLLLITRPAIPSRSSTVLRRRPDLDTAYVLSLAELERRSPPPSRPED